QQAWILCCVLDEASRGQIALGLRTIRGAKDYGKGTLEVASHGGEKSEPGLEQFGTDADHRLGQPGSDFRPSGIAGVVGGQGTGRREETRVTRSGRFDHRPELRN